ncbi:MAG: glycoside hydrolase family 3 protein, partial [Lachnospiraceae bacterium]
AYDPGYEIDPFVKGLTDEELCYIGIGSFSSSPLSIVGNQSKKVAGAAGDFTTLLEEKGFPCIVTADGPAGIRISRKYVVDKKGKMHALGNDMLVLFADAMPKFMLKALSLTERKPKKGETVYEQYCTMIPIAAAVAQSFNVQMSETLGDIIGTEMECFGVDFWLAPAMNIHRNPLCGRNFEYYSEDPLLTGKMAASITRGVQSHPGCGVTIKHYAANNQETNRYSNNSHVSERAMREIYLKGFGICVREAAPLSVMTSYNLLNGVHTSEHRGLIEDILRSEFGFDGIVMTDWIVAAMHKGGRYEAPVSWKVANAGGDVLMPGSKAHFDTLVKGLKEGNVTRQQLEINATRMYRMACRLTEAKK